MKAQSRRNLSGAQKVAATESRAFRTFLLMAQFEAAEIGARIAQARKERGLSQEDLAALASFSKRSLQDYEGGVTIPYRHLQEIGRLLKKPHEWFLYGDEDGTGTSEVRQAIREEMAEANEILRSLETRLASVERRLDEGSG